MEGDVGAERTREDTATGVEEVGAFREAKRAGLARVLDRMLRIARREAQKRDTPGQMRLRWVSTVAYLTQTYNNLLRDTEVDELNDQVDLLLGRVEKLGRKQHQQS